MVSRGTMLGVVASVGVLLYIVVGSSRSPMDTPLASDAMTTTSPPQPPPTTTTRSPSAWPDTSVACHFKPLSTEPQIETLQDTNCPEEELYVARWARRRSRAHHWILVDVGVNKGFTMAGMLETLGLDQNGTYSKERAYRLVQKAADALNLTGQQRLPLCGGCGECHERPMKAPQNAKGSVEIHAYDGARVNAAFVKEFFKGHPNVSVKHAAVGASRAKVQFPDVSLGHEGFGIGVAGDFPQIEVDVVTLNEELRGLPYIDVLLTDTEGHDYYVADGASDFIDNGLVGLYIFELHGGDRKIGDHVRRLHRAGYECFWGFRPPHVADRLLVPVSGACWNPSYDNERGWKNLVCANKRQPELMEALEALYSDVNASRPHG